MSEVNVGHIPAALKAPPQWVCWGEKHRQGKPTKVPINPTTGKPAKVDDPSTWGTFEDALARYECAVLAGIGFVITAKDPFVGVDLDHCRNAGTGELEPTAAQIVRRLDSYTEVSPSGEGVHIWVRAHLPSSVKQNGIEMYGKRRYFTMTGRHLSGTPLTIEERSEEVAKLHKQVTAGKDGAATAPTGGDKRIREGERNIILTSMAGTMRQKGFSQDAIEAALLKQNAAQCDPPLPDDEVHAIAKSVARYKPAVPNAGFVKTLADHILAEGAHFARDAGGRLYRYVDGVYKADGVEYVAARMKAILERKQTTKCWSSYKAREVAEYVRIDAPPLWERPPLEIMNLRNGLLHVPTGTLSPHSPEHYSPIQLPVSFNHSATCQACDQFIAEVFPPDAQVLAYEMVAWLMRPDLSMQVAALLIGQGANGKSTFLSLLTTFLGLSNVVSLSLHRLENDRFTAARLLGKLASICPDLPSEHLRTTSTFKALVGGDRLIAERKFQNSFEFMPFSRLVFSANHYPQSQDASEAFFRRWILIPFERTFPLAKQVPRPDLDARLAAPDELSGLLNRGLRTLPGLLKRGRFTESESTRVAWLEFREQTDPVAVWLDVHTVTEAGAMVTKKDLFITYTAHATAQGRPPMTATGFGLAIKRLRPGVRDYQRKVSGSVQWVYLGLGLLKQKVYEEAEQLEF
ncbi:phage/plasmid primase, P4 family [Nitrospiraceae bacterium AH_259_D15_M11_P09]|nr:phage/plasmid primase, P4 family [Nitrospiraceae bacterium AH_259_D15_M11_P09]